MTPLPSLPARIGDPMMPLVSVVIPAYNVEAYVAEALRSALRQTYPHREVIVVDDGSTDRTLAVIARTRAEHGDPPLTVVRQPNRGLSAARNAGLRAARGELIAFLDGDDAWRDDKLARHVRVMTADPGVGVSFSESEYMTEDGRPTGDCISTRNLLPSLHAMLRRNHFGNGSTVVARRECFEQAGVFREDLKSCEDYEMWCRLLWATDFRAVGIASPLTLYRVRSGSLSFDVGKFTANADHAMRVLRSTMRNVPESLFRAGHAEHYRIAAMKAAMCGRNGDAARLLGCALRLWPPILLADAAPAATAVLLLLPLRLRQPLLSWIKARPRMRDAAAGQGAS